MTLQHVENRSFDLDIELERLRAVSTRADGPSTFVDRHRTHRMPERPPRGMRRFAQQPVELVRTDHDSDPIRSDHPPANPAGEQFDGEHDQEDEDEEPPEKVPLQQLGALE